MDILTIAIAALISLIVGTVLGISVRRLQTFRSKVAARSEAERMLEQALEEQRSILLEAKEESLKIQKDGDDELKERRGEVRRIERRVANREENAEKRSQNLERRERKLNDREKEIENLYEQAEVVKSQSLQQLETVADMKMDDAKDIIMATAEDDYRHELALKYRDMEESVKNEANDKARMILGQAIQRLASDVVSEATVSTVPIPSDDMKGRLIGREGRNIRSIERNTGVDLIIDDTPEAITLSCFDPVRREVARLAVSKLVADGRIHPARIEDMVKKSQEEVEETIWKSGESAVLEADVRGLHPELIRLLGRLKYRFSSVSYTHLTLPTNREV